MGSHRLSEPQISEVAAVGRMPDAAVRGVSLRKCVQSPNRHSIGCPSYHLADCPPGRPAQWQRPAMRTDHPLHTLSETMLTEIEQLGPVREIVGDESRDRPGQER